MEASGASWYGSWTNLPRYLAGYLSGPSSEETESWSVKESLLRTLGELGAAAIAPLSLAATLLRYPCACLIECSSLLDDSIDPGKNVEYVHRAFVIDAVTTLESGVFVGAIYLVATGTGVVVPYAAVTAVGNLVLMGNTLGPKLLKYQGAIPSRLPIEDTDWMDSNVSAPAPAQATAAVAPASPATTAALPV